MRAGDEQAHLAVQLLAAALALQVARTGLYGLLEDEVEAGDAGRNGERRDEQLVGDRGTAAPDAHSDTQTQSPSC